MPYQTLFCFFLLLLLTTAHAQHIDSTRWLPALLTNQDTLQLMVRSSWLCCGPLVLDAYDVQVVDSLVSIEACYEIGLQDTSGGSRDSLMIGLLPPGRYQLALRLYGKDLGSPSPCLPQARDSLFTAFEVALSSHRAGKRPPPALSLFPNPAPGAFTLRSPQATIVSIALYDLTGRRLPAKISHDRHEAQVRSSYRGLALVKVLTDQGMWVQKVRLE